jgi:hypothetical protein
MFLFIFLFVFLSGVYRKSTGHGERLATNSLARASSLAENSGNNSEDSTAPLRQEDTDSFTDSFEGPPPKGWKSEWHATGPAGTLPSGLQTVTEVTPPRGGGKHTLRQWWHEELSSWAPEWLVYTFPLGTTDEGNVFEFEYYLMYDANFDHQKQTIKSVILRNEKGSQECYINTSSFGPIGEQVTVRFQQVTDTFFLSSNINGPAFVMPAGEWVHFRWQIKLSTEDQGDRRSGHLYGWINGVKRWEYDGINTIHSGKYRELNLNSTFNGSEDNPASFGPNQKRYWDLFSVKTMGHHAEVE